MNYFLTLFNVIYVDNDINIKNIVTTIIKTQNKSPTYVALGLFTDGQKTSLIMNGEDFRKHTEL